MSPWSLKHGRSSKVKKHGADQDPERAMIKGEASDKGALIRFQSSNMEVFHMLNHGDFT